jgi:hypothetical protein
VRHTDAGPWGAACSAMGIGVLLVVVAIALGT